MIVMSLIRATYSKHGERRVEMTHRTLPPSLTLGAGPRLRVPVPELAEVGRALLPRGCTLPNRGSPGAPLVSLSPYLEDATPHLFLPLYFRLN